MNWWIGLPISLKTDNCLFVHIADSVSKHDFALPETVVRHGKYDQEKPVITKMWENN